MAEYSILRGFGCFFSCAEPKYHTLLNRSETPHAKKPSTVDWFVCSSQLRTTCCDTSAVTS